MAKFKYPAKPKAPKASAPASSHEKFHKRWADHISACKAVDKAKADHAKAVKKTQDLKSGKVGRKK